MPTGRLNMRRIRDVKVAPAMAASQKPGQMSFAPPYCTAPRTALSCGVARQTKKPGLRNEIAAEEPAALAFLFSRACCV